VKLGKALKWGSTVAVAVAMTTACGTSNNTENTSNAAANSGSAAKKVEIFSWWTGAGEADGLQALIKLFQKQNPDYQVQNSAVAGGAGTNAKQVLATRMKANNPPDTFQVHGGAELMSWVDAGKMEPLNDLYQQEGWNDKFPKQLIDMVSKDGNIYGVPVDIHRGNVLWYNKKIFDQYHLTPPKTFDDFFKDADVLKSHGVTPLALGDKDTWEATMLWEDVLLGTIGADKYDQLWQGKLSFDDPGVKQSLETFKKMLSYTNSDHASLVWQDASQLVANGKAAMNVMGDWAKGYYTTDLHLKPNVDFGWVTTPGTDSDFMVITDTFGLPKGAPHRDGTLAFLKVLGSEPGQDAFNPLKGSIPARLDADTSKYDVYSQSAIQDFKKDTLTPSLAHGSAANPGFLDAVNQAMQVFVSSGDVDGFIAQLKSAAQQNPLGQ
jgi:glucose/mannose transport system substrate-binding protein